MSVEEIIRPSFPESKNKITAAFSTARHTDASGQDNAFTLAFNDGVDPMIVEQNRRLWLRSLRLEHHELALGQQVHGSNVRIVDSGGLFEETDGLVACKPGLAVGILVADCAAVLLSDSRNGIIAAVHAGWRGALDGILEKALFKMLLCGGDVSEVEVWISPCISLPAFEVGQEVACRFPDDFVDYSSYAKPHVDLKGYISRQLVLAGVDSSRIQTDTHCTVNEAGLHSFRRDGGKSGRMMGIIALHD